MGALSADHLDHIDDGGIEAMKQSGTIATLLPGVSFFLHNDYPPARKIIDAYFAQKKAAQTRHQDNDAGSGGKSEP